MGAPLTAPRRGSAPRRVRWLYHFTDFRSGLLLGTLPLRDVRMSEVLGAPSDGEAVVPLDDRSIRRDPFRATIPRRSVLWAVRQEVERGGRVVDERVLWSGIVMRRERKRAARSMNLGLVTWESYYKHRLIGFDRFHSQVDKHAILADLIAQGSEQPYLNNYFPVPPSWSDPHLTGIGQGVPNGGVLADRTYLASSLKPVLEAAQELAASGSGLQWRLVPERTAQGVYRMRLAVGTPRLGRVQPADVRWTDDDNDTRAGWLLDYTLTEDGAATRNRVIALGEGTGPDQLRGEAVDIDEYLAGYPILEGSLGSSTQDLRTQQSVDEHAEGALAAGKAAEVQLTGVTVRGDLAPNLTRYSLGDDGTFDLASTTTGQSTRVVGQIVARTITPAQRGRTEQVALDVQGRAA